MLVRQHNYIPTCVLSRGGIERVEGQHIAGTDLVLTLNRVKTGPPIAVMAHWRCARDQDDRGVILYGILQRFTNLCIYEIWATLTRSYL